MKFFFSAFPFARLAWTFAFAFAFGFGFALAFAAAGLGCAPERGFGFAAVRSAPARFAGAFAVARCVVLVVLVRRAAAFGSAGVRSAAGRVVGAARSRGSATGDGAGGSS